MISNTYEAFVQMKPEMDNRHFFTGDDDFTYQVPQVYFECLGETDNSPVAFDWSDNSVITVKDNRVVKYTECTLYELLMTDANGESSWVDGRLADCMGWNVKNVKQIRPKKSYMIEEYDLNNSEKRRYKVVLEETTNFEEYELEYLKKVIESDSKCNGNEYTLTQP